MGISFVQQVFLTSLLVCFGVTNCEKFYYSYTFVEDENPPISLGNISQQVNLINYLPDGEDHSNLRYSFLNQDLDFKHKDDFSIDEYTSEIKITSKLDRDTICAYSPNDDCKIELEVAAQSIRGTYFETIDITMIITDLNDHAPTFERTGPLELTISESSHIGSERIIDSAIDMDSSKYSVKSYRVVPSTAPFVTNFTKNLDGRTTVVKLVVTGELDREIIDQYQLQVIAEDGGNPPKSGTLFVNIKLSDVNDKAPVFSKPFYNISVKEDVQLHTSILEVHATDLDVGINGEVTYRISSTQPLEIQQLFSIEQTTGILKIVKALQPSETYNLIVEAIDKGEQPWSTQVYVHVNVENSRNNPPKININLLYGTNVAKISEYASMGSAVAHVKVIDTDPGKNGIVTCIVKNTVSGDSYFSLEKFADVNEYKVTVQKALDRESIPLHFITVVCNDYGSPQEITSANFTAEVLDENDMPPVFSKPLYTYSINENNTRGIAVIHVIATDQDKGDNAKIIYDLDEEAKKSFAINQESGVIYADIVFDRETIDQYKFQVIAVDKGNPPLSSTATVILNINDTNDNYPVFTQTSYTLSIKENMPIDTNVTKLSASDKDLGESGYITFLLDPKSRVPFFVLPDGSIRTTEILDREVKTGYVFTVTAKDNGSPALKSQVQVTINVDDENDNAPVITFPNVSNDTVKIPYSSRQNTVIATINAHDLDAGVNQKLLYSIQERNDSDIFNINSLTGEVIIAKRMQKSNMNKYFIQVVVSDQGSVYQSSKTKLNLFVTDTNGTVASIQEDDSHQYNIAIVVTVVVVTLVLSATILVTIFIIRHLDRQKRKYSEGLVLDGTKLTGPGMAPLTAKDDGKALPLYSQPGENVGMLYSYATENALDRMSLSSNNTFQASFDRGCQGNATDNLGRSSRCDSPRDDHRQSELHRLASIRLQQALIQSNDKSFVSQHSEHHDNKDLKRVSDDHNSDTSGETIPSDSGRGNSEDEIQSVSHSHTSEDFRKMHNMPPMQYGRRGETPHKKYPESHYMNMSCSPNSHVSSISSGLISPRLHDELKHQFQPNYLTPPRPQKLSYGSTEIPSYGNFQQGLMMPPVDDTGDSVATGYDDDDNTTTSGSYTIDNEDFPMELHLERVHDVFV